MSELIHTQMSPETFVDGTELQKLASPSKKPSKFQLLTLGAFARLLIATGTITTASATMVHESNTQPVQASELSTQNSTKSYDTFPTPTPTPKLASGSINPGQTERPRQNRSSTDVQVSPYPTEVWNLLRIQAPQVWEASGVTGRGVKVAVVDTGVADHRELRNKIIARLDLTNSPYGTDDRYNHGTHVAGIIAA